MRAFGPRAGQRQCRMRAGRGLQIYKCGACTLLLRGGARLFSVAVQGGLAQIYVFADCYSYFNSFTGKARNPWARGKLCAARQTIVPAVIRDLPTTLRTNSRFTASLFVGTSLHLASKSSKRPPMSTTKSTSRDRSRQKNRLP